MSSYTLQAGLKRIFDQIRPQGYEEMLTGQDVTFKFLSAEDLPKMDLSGTADPYFVAKLDGQVFYKSTITPNTLSPQWTDEECIVLNVPINARLTIEVLDKDDNKLGHNDYIGQFEIQDLQNYQPPPKGHLILGTSNEHNGRFHLSIESVESPEASKRLPRYTFDGPCRFIRHNAPVISRLILTNTDRVYYTWKISLRRISFFFNQNERQPWNPNHRAAQNVFTGNTKVTENLFKFGHKMLYGQTIRHNENGRLTSADDLWKLVFLDEKTGRMRARIYTYIIDDNTWRFGETGDRVFVNYASKHVLHANCSRSVRYAGEFHPRPKYGWDRWDDDWELVFDNHSGTYAPSADLMDSLKGLLQFNFPGLHVVTYDREDPLLKQSVKTLEAQEKKYERDSSSFKNLMVHPSLEGSNETGNVSLDKEVLS